MEKSSSISDALPNRLTSIFVISLFPLYTITKQTSACIEQSVVTSQLKQVGWKGMVYSAYFLGSSFRDSEEHL